MFNERGRQTQATHGIRVSVTTGTDADEAGTGGNAENPPSPSRGTPGREAHAAFDEAVLAAVRQRWPQQTCVVANWLRTDEGRRPATAKVLRACRRLQKRGLIEETRSSYAVMKTWRPSPTPPQETGHE